MHVEGQNCAFCSGNALSVVPVGSWGVGATCALFVSDVAALLPRAGRGLIAGASFLARGGQQPSLVQRLRSGASFRKLKPEPSAGRLGATAPRPGAGSARNHKYDPGAGSGRKHAYEPGPKPEDHVPVPLAVRSPGAAVHPAPALEEEEQAI